MNFRYLAAPFQTSSYILGEKSFWLRTTILEFER